MNTVITFTPAQLVAFIGAVCGVIASIGAAVAIIAKLITQIRKPEMEQNRKIEALENENKIIKGVIKALEIRLDEGNDRFGKIEASTQITLETLRALLKHALGGDESELKDAEKNLDNYLIQNKTKQ